MYLHLGEETDVFLDDVIGVFDLDTTTVVKTSRDFLSMKEKQGKINIVSYELPKSFILCVNDEKEETIYLSQISPQTLLKRKQTIDHLFSRTISF